MSSSQNHALDITLTMTSGLDHRRITLEAGRKTEVGRASRSENRNAVATSDNALFDCPVVSRNHAELAYHPFEDPGKEVNIKDLGSKHGTTVNDKKLTPGVQYDLHSGDRIKFGGPITVGAENHDGITMTYNPVIPLSLSEMKEAQPSVRRGFRAPSPYESDNDCADPSLVYASDDFDEDYEDGNEGSNDEHEEDDDDSNDEEEEDDDENEDQDKHDEDGAEQEDDTTSQTTPDGPKIVQSFEMSPPIPPRYQYNPVVNDSFADANTVIIPDSIDASVPLNKYQGEPSSSNGVTAHATRFWPETSMRDFFNNGPLASHSDVSDDGSDESLWDRDLQKPDEDRNEASSLVPIVKENKPSTNTGISHDHQQMDKTNHIYYPSKPRYDPVRSSPVPMVNQFPSFSTSGADSTQMCGLDFILDQPHACPAISQQTKNDSMQGTLVTNEYTPLHLHHVLGTAGPSNVEPQPTNLHESCALPAVDDVVQSFAWMDQPNHPISFNKIPIPALMKQSGKEGDKAPEGSTEREPETQTGHGAVVKGIKRKADEIEDAVVTDIVERNTVKKARNGSHRPADNRYATLKGVVIGMVGGAIGTMAFLASPATDVLLDWLEV